MKQTKLFDDLELEPIFFKKGVNFEKNRKEVGELVKNKTLKKYTAKEFTVYLKSIAEQIKKKKEAANSDKK